MEFSEKKIFICLWTEPLQFMLKAYFGVLKSQDIQNLKLLP